MHSVQTKTHSPNPVATKTAESTQKVTHSAGAATRLPTWTHAWGDHPPASLQAKLTVNQPGDVYEQEADRVAEQVMRMPDSSLSVQRKCACGGTPGPSGECEECRNKRLALQRLSTNSGPSVVPPIVNKVLNGSGGRPLDSATRISMEPHFGYDFSHVRVHTNAQAAESAQAVNALAYTVGQNVVFGAGQYAPGTHAGQELLAHELTHVVQQRVSSGLLQRKMQVVNPKGALPGSPPRQNWEDIRDYITALCPFFSVDSSGKIAPSSGGACPDTSGKTACKCFCDLHNSKKIPLWKIQIDDSTWPHTPTDPSTDPSTVHSSRSAFSFGAWGGGAAAGSRISQDNAGVLSHEICGHAWLIEQGKHPRRPPSGKWHEVHDPTVKIENKIASERGGPGSEARGLQADPHRGESFARVTVSGFPNGSSDVSKLTVDMQAKLANVKDFVMLDPRILVDVIGHDDHLGKPGVRARISLERANNVKSKLEALGIVSTRFRDVTGKSDTECPSSSLVIDPACAKVDIFMFIEEAGSEKSP